MFVCGPTVYDYSHIGHARTYIAFDVVARYLRHKEFRVDYLQNITDLDDKIIMRASETGVTPQKLALEMERAYREDMEALNVHSVNNYARATAYIDAIIAQINLLIRRDFAYEADGNVYYDILKFPKYGELSGQKLEKLYKGVRVESDPAKRHPYDFALWKLSKPGEPKWPSPWGFGRPGWHIEDTAITDSLFGPQYDIHGGARDLIFPHHECEIAQMEAASGKSPMVQYWMHTGFLNVDSAKMSKSLGNFITIRDFLKSHEPAALRMVIISTQYRSPIDFTEKVALQAQEQLRRLREFAGRVAIAMEKPLANNKDDKSGTLVAKAHDEFMARMDDDFNTPNALATLAVFIRTAYPMLEKGTISQQGASKIMDFLKTVDDIFGLDLFSINGEEIPETVKRLANDREKARKDKKWQESDRLRSEISKLGYTVDDTPQGYRLKKN